MTALEAALRIQTIMARIHALEASSLSSQRHKIWRRSAKTRRRATGGERKQISWNADLFSNASTQLELRCVNSSSQPQKTSRKRSASG